MGANRDTFKKELQASRPTFDLLPDQSGHPSRNLIDPEYGYRYQAERLRQALGLPAGKLPDNEKPMGTVLGNVAVILLTREQAKRLMPRSRRPHRLYCLCPKCEAMTPTGRLQQHMKGCK